MLLGSFTPPPPPGMEGRGRFVWVPIAQDKGKEVERHEPALDDIASVDSYYDNDPVTGNIGEDDYADIGTDTEDSIPQASSSVGVVPDVTHQVEHSPDPKFICIFYFSYLNSNLFPSSVQDLPIAGPSSAVTYMEDLGR
jgi:hypothetical protein